MGITRSEYQRVLNTTKSDVPPWNVDMENYAVFPGDMKEVAEKFGDVEDILWEQDESHYPQNERFLLVALDEDIEEHISPDYSDPHFFLEGAP